jgi:hypothetical protein
MKLTTQLGLPVIPDLVGASSQFPEVPSELSNRPSVSATSGVHESPPLSTDLSADLPMADGPALNQETSADTDQPTHVPPAKRAALARVAANLKSMSGTGKTTKKLKRKSTVKPTSRKSQSKHVGGSKRAVHANIVPKKVVIKQHRAPDLPLPPPPIATEQLEDDIPYITPINEDPAETTAEGVKLKLFFIDQGRDPLEYEFKVSENAVRQFHPVHIFPRRSHLIVGNDRVSSAWLHPTERGTSIPEWATSSSFGQCQGCALQSTGQEISILCDDRSRVSKAERGSNLSHLLRQTHHHPRASARRFSFRPSRTSRLGVIDC